jgi:hypothetical protein
VGAGVVGVNVRFGVPLVGVAVTGLVRVGVGVRDGTGVRVGVRVRVIVGVRDGVGVIVAVGARRCWAIFHQAGGTASSGNPKSNFQSMFAARWLPLASFVKARQ